MRATTSGTPASIVNLAQAAMATGPRDYHAARWLEPLVFALHAEGQRGVVPPSGQEFMESSVPSAPEAKVQRSQPVRLPEIGQAQVLRHFVRLSQETLGADVNVDIGQGTCTMKYSPKVNERFVRLHRASALHPLQPTETVQGALEVISRLEGLIAEVTGMDAVSLQPGAGSAAIYANVKIVQAYHRSRGDGDQRDEVITTIFSHPSNAAAARTAGYKVITLYPGESGYPSLETLKAALSGRTAALFITNPEDTGIFNPHMHDFVEAVHEVGGLCVYDQANANGLLGVARAGDAGFDLGHLNLHKTFSTPHACGGPAAGAVFATAALAPFLPGPRIAEAQGTYFIQDPDPLSTAPIRPFFGVVPNLIRAYAWVRALGADGLREVANIAVLNNNYVVHRMAQIPGVSIPYSPGAHRIEQARYSWQDLKDETGISSGELGSRMGDFGFHYWTSHHPYVVPEPLTLEPTESYTKVELDEYVDALARVAAEARHDPEVVRSAPHRSSVHAIDTHSTTDPDTWAPSWRAFRHKYLGEAIPDFPRWCAPDDLPLPQRPAKAFHR
jgi:glycine dehydrogenase subunit 2